MTKDNVIAFKEKPLTEKEILSKFITEKINQGVERGDFIVVGENCYLVTSYEGALHVMTCVSGMFTNDEQYNRVYEDIKSTGIYANNSYPGFLSFVMDIDGGGTYYVSFNDVNVASNGNFELTLTKGN